MWRAAARNPSLYYLLVQIRALPHSPLYRHGKPVLSDFFSGKNSPITCYICWLPLLGTGFEGPSTYLLVLKKIGYSQFLIVCIEVCKLMALFSLEKEIFVFTFLKQKWVAAMRWKIIVPFLHQNTALLACWTIPWKAGLWGRALRQAKSAYISG